MARVMKPFVVFCTGLLLLALSACGDEKKSAASDAYQLRWHPCQSGVSAQVDCAELILPQAQDTLPVRILRYRGADKKAGPLVYLQGGPGYRLDFDASGIAAWQGFARQAGLKRDLILLNRRGSQTLCPEYRRAQRQAWLEKPASAQAQKSADELLVQCMNRQDTLAIDDYGTRQNADDIRALIRLLQVPHWHVLGVSYGTRLAIELAGSDGLNSLVLDSVYPPGLGGVLQSPRLLGQSVQTMARACASDLNCTNAWRTHFAETPLNQQNFIRQLQASLQSLQQQALDVEVTLDGWPETIWVTPERFLSAAFSASYNRYRWARLINAMAATGQRDRQSLSQFMQLSVAPLNAPQVSELAYTAVDCRDNRLGTEREFLQGLKPYPWLEKYMAANWQGQICQHWRDAIHPVTWPEKTAQTDKLRIAVLAGQFDPITPPDWARTVSEYWPQAQVSVFPATGHSVFSNRPCALRQLEMFLNKTQTTITPCAGSD